MSIGLEEALIGAVLGQYALLIPMSRRSGRLSQVCEDLHEWKKGVDERISNLEKWRGRPAPAHSGKVI